MKNSFYLCLLILLTGCNEEDVQRTEECSAVQVCTEVYMSLILEVKDSQGQPVAFTEYYTTKLTTGQKISYQETNADPARRKLGMYPILTDGDMDQTSLQGADFEFTGIKDGKVLVKKTFKIGHDCCHVKLLSGETMIVVD